MPSHTASVKGTLSHVHGFEQEAGRDGCTGPSEGVVPSALFRHGEQRAMAKGFPPRQPDPGLVKGLPHPTESPPRAS